MTEDEATQVLALFTAAHPKVTLTPTTVQVWFQAALSKTDFELGRRIALDLVAAERGFPTPAAFNAWKRRLKEQDDMRKRPAPEEPTLLPTDEAHRVLDEMRVKLGRPPRHGGAA